jgi:hypothetical protein
MTGWGFSYASLFTRTIQTRRRWFLSGLTPSLSIPPLTNNLARLSSVADLEHLRSRLKQDLGEHEARIAALEVESRRQQGANLLPSCVLETCQSQGISVVTSGASADPDSWNSVHLGTPGRCCILLRSVRTGVRFPPPPLRKDLEPRHFLPIDPKVHGRFHEGGKARGPSKTLA